MAVSNLVLGIPPILLSLIQQGLVERAFHDGLFPALQFRSEAAWEEWPENAGTEIFMTRPGLLAPVTTTLAAGQDPTPQTLSFEQWVATLGRYAGTIDTHMPSSAVAAANLFMRNIQQLGLQAGQSLNRISRNALYKPYLSGQTVLLTTTASTDTTIRVASLNGFRDAILLGTTVRPTAVSPSNPLPITIATVGVRNVIAASPDNANDPDGPGTLTLDQSVGSIVAARASVLSAFRPQLIRSGGGNSIDAIAANDLVTLQDFIDAVGRLRRANVRPHEDGFYHAHITNDANTQLFQDPVFQRLNTALPDGTYYQEAFIGRIAGIAFFLNNECPDSLNSGANTTTSANGATYSADIGAETVNDSAVRIGRAIITGRGTLYEKGLDESAYLTEAGVMGKVGEFQIVNAGAQISTERVKMIMRAPLNRMQDQVSATWSITTSFTAPSDITGSSGPERYKRAVVIEHALNS